MATRTLSSQVVSIGVRCIDHSGIDLAGWLTPAKGAGGTSPKPAAEGPLNGERIAILGAPRDGPLARTLAQSGARIVASVGTTTTMLVISNDQPFGRFAHLNATYKRAENLQRAGSSIAILAENSLRKRIVAGSGS